MDALKKAVLLLWQYNHLLEKEHDDIRKEFDAIRDLLIRYLGESKVDESQHPKTMESMLKVVRSLESRASHMEDFYRERLKTMNAIQAVFTDCDGDTTVISMRAPADRSAIGCGRQFIVPEDVLADNAPDWLSRESQEPKS